jgi:hypothetical protein
LSYADRNTKEGIRNIQKQLTVKQIFEHTPDDEGLISECFYRKLNDYAVTELKNRGECMTVFQVDKFYLQEYICYRFHIKGSNETSQKFQYRKIAFSLTHAGLFYGLFINQSKIPQADQCKVIVHESAIYPVDSAAYAPYFYRRENGSSKYDLVKVDYSVTEIDTLYPPYDTNCAKYTEFEEMQKNCVNYCLKKRTLKRFNKVPFTAPEDTPVNYKHIHGADLDNKTFSADLKKIEQVCDSKCSRPACEVEFSSTRIQKEERGRQEAFTIIVGAPGSPGITVKSVEAMALRQFVLFICSTFGTWFGISLLSYDPNRLQRVWERNQHMKKVDSQQQKKQQSHQGKLNLLCLKCRETCFHIRKEIMCLRILASVMMPPQYDLETPGKRDYIEFENKYERRML